jgi:hypothetical protein
LTRRLDTMTSVGDNRAPFDFEHVVCPICLETVASADAKLVTLGRGRIQWQCKPCATPDFERQRFNAAMGG